MQNIFGNNSVTAVSFLKQKIKNLQIVIQPAFYSRAECEVAMGNKYLDGTALTIVIIGAINWLLISIFRFDLVAFVFGDMSWFSRIIYAIVGICGLYLISFYLHLGSRSETTT